MNSTTFIDIDQLCVGMYIHLDMGWLDHPFALGHFRITTPEQIAVLRGLGLKQVRCEIDSGLWPVAQQTDVAAESGVHGDGAGSVLGAAVASGAGAQGGYPSQASGDAQFAHIQAVYRAVGRVAWTAPDQAKAPMEAAVAGLVDALMVHEHAMVRLLSEMTGEHHALHAVNVMVLSVMLGRAVGLSVSQLHDVGAAALVHDMGKLELPVDQREASAVHRAGKPSQYEQHVAHSVRLAQAIGLSPLAVEVVAKHHEMVDGSGFPQRLRSAGLPMAAQVVALVNRYDGLCYPPHGIAPLTPHDALTVMFAQMKHQFDPVVLGAFIHMMGIYPPGSIVQLADERYALVVSVHPHRPLRPVVMVYAPDIAPDLAPLLDLDLEAQTGIRKSMKPSQVPRPVLDYLSPRKRICYFFECRTVGADRAAASPVPPSLPEGLVP